MSARSASVVLCCLLALPILPVAGGAGVAAAQGTTVRGVVTRAPATPPPPAAPPRYRERRAPEPAVEATPGSGCQCDPGRFAVVWLTGATLPPPAPPAVRPRMEQKDRVFVPSVLAVPVGAEVDFPNGDPFFHNVFSYSKTRRFDLGRYPQGESASVVFDRAGVVPVFCEIHYSMRAYIHVLDTPCFAVSDEQRNFAIADVPPGEYVLHVWQENLPEIRRPIVVGAAPLELEIP